MAWQAWLGAFTQLAGGYMQAEAGDVAIQGKMSDMDFQINALMEQAGWERDFGDNILESTNRQAKRMKRVAFRQSKTMMDQANRDAMLQKSQAEIAASALISTTAGRNVDVGYGSPIETAALQLEVGEREAMVTMDGAINSVKSVWDDVKWETGEMKKSAKFQKKMSYRKAKSMEGQAGQIGVQKDYLQKSRGPQYFATMLGATGGALSSYTNLSSVYDKPSSNTEKPLYTSGNPHRQGY